MPREILRKTTAVTDHGALHQSDKLPTNRTNVIETVDNGFREIVSLLEDPFAIEQVSCEPGHPTPIETDQYLSLGRSVISRKVFSTMCRQSLHYLRMRPWFVHRTDSCF